MPHRWNHPSWFCTICFGMGTIEVLEKVYALGVVDGHRRMQLFSLDHAEKCPDCHSKYGKDGIVPAAQRSRA